MPRERNFWIKLSTQTNVKSCMKSRCGAYMRCRTICCKRTIRSCRKIGRRSQLVCSVFSFIVFKFNASDSVGIKRTKLRLLRCRVRMGMNDRDRLRDARADKNLDDVDRIPPPWEPQVAQPQPQVPGLVPPTPTSPLSRGVPVPQPSNGARGIPVG